MGTLNTPGWNPSKTYTGDPRRGRHIMRTLCGGILFEDVYIRDVSYPRR